MRLDRDCPAAGFAEGKSQYIEKVAPEAGESSGRGKETYETPLMKAVCAAMADVRSDKRMEAVEMTLEQKLMDVRYEGRQAGLAEGRQEGLAEAYQAVLRNLRQAGMTTAFMAQTTGRTETEVLAALAEMGLTPPEND